MKACFALLLLLLAINTLAYNADHGPFAKGQEPKAFKLQQCSTTKDGTNDATALITITATNGAPEKIIIDPNKHESGIIELQGEDGRTLVKSELQSDIFYGIQAYFADLNADKKTDYVIWTWSGGCGLACGYAYISFILSSSEGFNISKVTTLFPGPDDFVDIDDDGRCEFIHATFVYGDEEKSPDDKVHNYWVYNLITAESDKLKLANNKDNRFPKWIWYSLKENHKETKMLTAEQKSRLWEKYKENVLIK